MLLLLLLLLLLWVSADDPLHFVQAETFGIFGSRVNGNPGILSASAASFAYDYRATFDSFSIFCCMYIRMRVIKMSCCLLLICLV